jgi:hypothetical protein
VAHSAEDEAVAVVVIVADEAAVVREEEERTAGLRPVRQRSQGRRIFST